MTLVSTRSGNRVGWEIYDDEDQARGRARRARREAKGMEARGYDFGMQVPGEVRDNHDGTWTVVVP